ncbi:MAG: DUF1298 domain-containing protein, partial [Oxalobacteraceae bacterium]
MPQHPVARSQPVPTRLATADSDPCAVPLRDHLWLRTPSMVVTGVVGFSGDVSPARLLQFIENKIFAIERFTQKLTPRLGHLQRWARDPHLDAQHHLKVVHLNYSSSIQKIIDRVCDTPLDMSHPPWQITLVQRDRDTPVAIFRIHHVIADGRGLMEAMLRSADDPQAWPRTKAAWRAQLAGRAAALQPGRVQQLLTPLHFLGGLVLAMVHLARRPIDAPPRCLAGPLGPSQTYRMPPTSFRLQELRELAEHLGGGSINDVLLLIVTGALRRYTEACNEEPRPMRCLQPVRLPPTAADGIGNGVSVGSCRLPLHLSDRRQMLAALRQQMAPLKKGSAEVAGNAWLASLLGLLPAAYTRSVFRRVTRQ